MHHQFKAAHTISSTSLEPRASCGGDGGGNLSSQKTKKQPTAMAAALVRPAPQRSLESA